MDFPLQLFEYDERDVELTVEEKIQMETTFKKYINSSFKQEINPETQHYHGKIQSKFYIGILHISQRLDIIIKPKIHFADFITMLTYVDTKRVRVWHELAENIERVPNFIYYFLKIFLEDTYILLLKCCHYGYQRNSIVEKVPRGKIQIISTISQQYQIPPRFICQVHEFSSNIIENQIIRWTLEYITPLISGDLLPIYRNLLNLLKEVELKKIFIQDIDRLHYTKLTQPYHTIHDFCRLILQDFSLDFNQGNEHCYAFVLNSWNVYEKFLFAILNQFQNKYHVDAYKIKDINEEIDWDQKFNSFNRPDMILSDHEEKPRIIIDAKYKFESGRTDKLQIKEYIGERSLQLGFLIYPFSTDRQEPLNRLGSGMQQHVRVIYSILFINLSKIKDRQYLQDFVNNILNVHKEAEINSYNYDNLMDKFYFLQD